MAKTYKLVNPYIGGKFKTEFSGKNSLDVANKAYTALSKHFNNNLPVFYFTMQSGSKFKHFKITESRGNKDSDIEYLIKEHDVAKDSEAKFTTKLGRFKQKGGYKMGKKRRYHDDDYLDDEDDYLYQQKGFTYYPVADPISFWWYDPYLYRINKFYVPTFYQPLTPYIEIDLFLE